MNSRAIAVWCRQCGALPGQACLTASGEPTTEPCAVRPLSERANFCPTLYEV